MSESRSKFWIEKIVKDWIKTAVGAAHPLGDGDGPHPEMLRLFCKFLSLKSRQLEMHENGVEWKKGEGKKQDNSGEHS